MNNGGGKGWCVCQGKALGLEDSFKFHLFTVSRKEKGMNRRTQCESRTENELELRTGYPHLSVGVS